jgi:site-specific DNA recombinase
MNIGYIRNSTLKQENSVETQRKQIKDYCEINNLVLDQIIIDEGISGGGDKTDLRKGYNQIIDLIDQGEVDNLVVISISRWGRNLGETYKSVKLMGDKDTKFISIKENIDTSSPVGRFTLNILSSLYEMELEMIRERTKDTLKYKKENNLVYSKTPYGFDRVGDRLIENPKEKRLIKKMNTLKDKGFSYNDISLYLLKNRHKTKSGGKWTRQNVYKVMKNHIVN